MTERLQLNDAIYNPYAVEHLEPLHPALFAAFGRWFAAVNDFEEQPLLSLLAARSPAELERHRAAAQTALAGLPGFLRVLDELGAALDGALAVEPSDSGERALLNSLSDAARHNRREFDRVAGLVAQKLSGGGQEMPPSAGPERAVYAAAERLDALAVRAADAAARFVDLRGLIGEWKQVWADLDAALEGLPRQDERRLRQLEQGRIEAATKRLTANLLAAKQKAREAGERLPGEVPQHGDSVADRFAVAILRGAYAEAVSLLAPWLQAQWSEDSLRDKVVTLSELASEAIIGPEGNAIQLVPGDYHLGKNPMSLSELRRIPSRPWGWGEIPAEVTEENYIGWVLFDLMTDEDDSFLTNVDNLVKGYVIPVRTAEGDRIGFVFLGQA